MELMPSKTIKLTCPCSYFQPSELIQTYCKCGHDISHHGSRCIYTWSEEIRPVQQALVYSKPEETSREYFDEQKFYDRLPDFLLDIGDMNKQVGPKRRSPHCSQTYTLHDDVTKDYLSDNKSLDRNFVPEADKRYMLKCNRCNYIWNTLRYGHIPKRCPSCKVLIDRPFFKDHHENADYADFKYCAGCKKKWPKHMMYCEFCKFKLGTRPRETKLKHVEDKRIDTSDIEDDYTKLKNEDREKQKSVFTKIIDKKGNITITGK